MPLQPGTCLGPYSVTAKLGEGGMGEVYRARDTKLDRDVALKVLPQAFTEDPDRLARFEREAKVLASLNHPGIAGIYGLEESGDTRALVLELVEGPTLADRIAKGPIPLDEALPIAKQIAEALEAAHEAGVIHRDLKPANIKVRDDGTVKVLDFGLAKAFQPDASDPGLSQSPTISLTAAATQMGMVIGTAAYMAPEQASGKVVDKRCDVWAFGVVLYEMLTGTRPFVGNDVSKTLARVIDREPDWDTLPGYVPPGLSNVLRHCLQKNPKKRIRDIGDVSLAMEGAFETFASVQLPDALRSPPTGWRRIQPWAAGIALGASVAGMAAWAVTRPTPSEISRLHMMLPTGSGDIAQHVLAISPEGDHLAYVGSDRLYLRRMDQLEATSVVGSEGAREPFFSPDGEWVGFFVATQLMKAAVSGGPPVAICEVNASVVYGAHWTPDDAVYFSVSQEGIWRVSARGGTPELVIPLAGDQQVLARPQLLPGGEWLLATAYTGLYPVAISLLTGEQHVLIDEVGGDVAYLPTGHLAHVRDGILLVVPFDAERRTVTGGQVPLIDGVEQANNTVAQFVTAADGTLAYLAGSAGSPQRSLVWVDRTGREEPLDMPPRWYARPRLSPDGRRLVVDTPAGDDELYVYDFDTGVEERFTFDPAPDRNPVWSPDGSQIVFQSFRDQPDVNGVWSKSADGTGSARSLGSFPFPAVPWDWTDDGDTLLFGGPGFRTLRVDSDGAQETVLETPFSVAYQRIAPNGRWVAYSSNEGGTRQIWARPFPDVSGGQRLVSDGSGEDPLWAPDGRELFYVTREDAMVVRVEIDETFQRGAPERMFSMAPYFFGVGVNWDVSPDGQRFLMVKRDSASVGRQGEVTIVQNWFEEVRARVPVQ